MNFQTIGNVLLWLAAIPAVGSVALFSRVRWWTSPWGRHLMGYMTAVSIPLVLGCIRQVAGDSSAFQVLRGAALVLLMGTLWWRLWILWTTFREGPPAGHGP